VCGTIVDYIDVGDKRFRNSRIRILDQVVSTSGLEQFPDAPPIHAHEVNRAVDAHRCSCGKRFPQKHDKSGARKLAGPN
jgi:hypothetical protein